MPTRAQLAEKVMIRMGVLDVNEAPTAKESENVQETMNSIYLSLKERGKISWSLDAIPTQYLDAFVNLVADRASPDFGVADPVLNQRAQLALKEIYALSSKSIDERAQEPVDY